MPRLYIGTIALAFAAAACSPTFNWREVRVEPARLKAMLPCKPDHADREVPMAGRSVKLEVVGCDTGGATFALMSADIGDAAQAGAALAQWKRANLANMRSTGSSETAFAPGGASPLRESLQVVAGGTRADGSPVESRAAYFAQGSRVFQAVIFTNRLQPEFSEPFFGGLRFE
ncbi:hypothetical protein [Caenimonas aquaedulcis]|uniref:Uncharacterized protein n=1 Tax=Caenimonas aquaedulcis TaxID=2793270 RepID=A0A931H5C3_9BURK|nr:hypothetical protein [Caenimonas aquaedulcis]MBG9388710.1 hypothetical protein [Caenimonas aquaedulcis]